MLAWLLATGGCARWLPAPQPMRAVKWPPADSAGGYKAKCLMVFLPGAGDSAEDFEKHGFVADVRKRQLAVDMVAANATLGYYARGTFPARLFTDVFAPARAAGRYRQVWVVGMSMGGLGTFLFSREHAAEVTGVLALAPYLGENKLTDEIRAQGGLARWKAPPPVKTVSEQNYQRELWRWLQAVTQGQERGPEIYLGHGNADRLAPQDALLAAALPAGHVWRTEGGHAWPVWELLFERFLDDAAFVRACR